MRLGTRKSTRQRSAPKIGRRRRDETSWGRDETSSQAHEWVTSELEVQPEQRTRRTDGPEERERRTGGPQDRALYVCRCGSAFQAVVSASVRCPHCGDAQAW